MSTSAPAQTTAVVATPKAPINFGNTGVQLSTLEDAFRFANAVVKSGLAPKGFSTPEAVLIALQHGAEVGLPPMAALQSIAVINGRPGIFGDAALALVRGSGICIHHGEAETDNTTDPIFRKLQFAIFERDLEKVKALQKEFSEAQSKHKATAEDFGVTVATARQGGLLEFERFTIADAKLAGLWGKEGPWRQYPKRMLKFRARGFKLRDTYGDVLKGLRTTEELQDLPAELNVTPKKSLGTLIGGEPESAGEGAATHAAESTEKPAETFTEAVRTYTPDERAALLKEVEGLMLDNGVTEAKVMLFVHQEKLGKEGQDEIGALDSAVLDGLRGVIPTLKKA